MHQSRILILESHADSRSQLQSILQLSNLACGSCADTDTAVQMAETYCPDALIVSLDIGGGAYEACERIRAVPGCSDLPIVISAAGQIDEAQQCEALVYGALAWLKVPYVDFEVLLTVTTMLKIRQLQGELAQRVTDLDRLASTDALTGLYNRRQVINVLTQEIARSRRFSAPIAVAIADLDHFKSVNDTYGHKAGDDVLQSVAQSMRASLRAGDTVGRIGGEEFMFVLPAKSMQAAKGVAERIRHRIEDTPIDLGSVLHRQTISIGLVFAERLEQASPEVLMEMADKALYESKMGGRNQVTTMHGFPEVDPY